MSFGVDWGCDTCTKQATCVGNCKGDQYRERKMTATERERYTAYRKIKIERPATKVDRSVEIILTDYRKWD